MDIVEIGKWIAGASDRVLLISVFIVGIRYLINRNERQSDQMIGLLKDTDASRVKVAEALLTAAKILERVEKKL